MIGKTPTTLWFAGLVVLLAGLPLRAEDQDGCLRCHQYRGLARVQKDGANIALYSIDPNYYTRGLGPHARLRCTDCHERQEVEVFPHRPASPVDCTRACHLNASPVAETRFSHERVAGMLGKSVHNAKVLEEANRLLGQPLRDGQSRCLLCHDEPTFRRDGGSFLRQESPLRRCDSCHNEQLPRDTRFGFWHVAARAQPARSHQDTVRLCGMCHSNPQIRQRFNLPDATASFLNSFHGKATLLGQETAGCLDCHVGPMQNVHVMHAKSDPASPTHPDRLPDTCRTPACHRGAGAQISTAAIHMDLATDRGLEYLIGIIFVLLIVFTFGPSLLLTALKMLHSILGREEPALERNLHLAEKLMADPRGRQRLMRFTPHQRVQHWFLMVCFTTLVITGFPMKFADRPWAAWLINLLGGLPNARLVHRWAGALLIAGFVYHMAYVVRHVIRERRRSGQSLFRVVMNLPMTVRPADAREMAGLMAYMLFLKKTKPEGERFNPEEKFEYIGVFWGTFVLGVTGLLMWANESISRYLPGRVLTVASLLHTFEAFLALLHVGIVHMVTVVFSPGVFPMSRAMFTGDTPAEELAEAHAGMVAEAAHELGISPPHVEPSPAAAVDAAAVPAPAPQPGQEVRDGQ